MLNRLITQQIISNGLIAALYVVLTITPPLNAIAYLGVQFRLSEVLLLLVFFRKDYIVGIVIGTFIANMFGPIGSFAILDAFLGSLVTLVAGFFIGRSKQFLMSMITPVLFNGLYLGIFLPIYVGDDLNIFNIGGFGLSVAFGQFVVLYGLGYPLYLALRKNTYFLRLIGATQNVR
jgi:uncharacterized membrane protein